MAKCSHSRLLIMQKRQKNKTKQTIEYDNNKTKIKKKKNHWWIEIRWKKKETTWKHFSKVNSFEWENLFIGGLHLKLYTLEESFLFHMKLFRSTPIPSSNWMLKTNPKKKTITKIDTFSVPETINCRNIEELILLFGSPSLQQFKLQAKQPISVFVYSIFPQLDSIRLKNLSLTHFLM